MSAQMTLEATLDAHPERLGEGASWTLQAEARASTTEGLASEVAAALEPSEDALTARWTATVEALPEAGEAGSYATLALLVPGGALPARTSMIYVGAGLCWESVQVDPVGLEAAKIPVTLELELDEAGQWSGAVEVIASEDQDAMAFADTDIVAIPGCAGLPPMQHTLWRVTASGGLAYSRLTASSRDWAELNGRRTLLFVHGTGLNAKKTLGFMEASSGGLVSELVRRYEGRMLAFNHSTVFHTVEQNIEALLPLIAKVDPATGGRMSLNLDILAVSRGGLVTRALIEGLVPTGDLEVSARSVVFLGTPNDGTWSAVTNNTSCVLGVRCICNQGDPELGEPPPAGKFKRGQVNKGQPGARDQQPGSALLERLNRGAGATSISALHPGLRYHAVSSSIWLPEDHSKRGCVDEMFGRRENDLVVPVESTFAPAVSPESRFAGLLPIPEDRRLHFQPGDFVTHVDYINQPRVHAQLRAWLPGADAPGLS